MAEKRQILTDIKVNSRQPKEKPYEVPDGKIAGLYLTVRPSGARSFNLRYRFAGKPRNLTIGPAEMGLASARGLAQEALVQIARGADPAAIKAARKAEERAPKLDEFAAVAERFVQIYCIGPDPERPRIRDWRESDRLLQKHFVPEWKGKRLVEITRADIHAALDKIVASGAAIGANRAFAQLRKMFGWAVDRGLIDHNPCAGMARPSSEKGRARERVLDARELSLVWRASGALGDPWGPMVKLLILTGQRRTEVGAMEWSEVDIAAAEWILPPRRSKNHREHRIPLTATATAILGEVPKIATANVKGAQPRFVFTTDGSAASSGLPFVHEARAIRSPPPVWRRPRPDGGTSAGRG